MRDKQFLAEEIKRIQLDISLARKRKVPEYAQQLENFAAALEEEIRQQSVLRVLVCGSRWWANKETIRRELSALPLETLIIHGDNGYDLAGRALWKQPDALAVRGADKLAGAVAAELGFAVQIFTPDWSIGKAAGGLRNQRMLDEGKPSLVLAFHEDLQNSRGTVDMLRRAEIAGVPAKVFGG